MLVVAVRWIASIVLALCLVGAGALRSQRHVTGDPDERTELSPASHLVAKVVPRRDSGLPDQRLGSCVLLDPTALLAERPAAAFRVQRRTSPPSPAPELHVRGARGPPRRG